MRVFVTLVILAFVFMLGSCATCVGLYEYGGYAHRQAHRAK